MPRTLLGVALSRQARERICNNQDCAWPPRPTMRLQLNYSPRAPEWQGFACNARKSDDPESCCCYPWKSSWFAFCLAWAVICQYEQQKCNDAEAASRASAIEGTNDSSYDPLNDEVLDQTFCEASGKTKAATKTEEAPKQPRNLAAYDADLVSRELDSKLYPPKRFAYRSNQYVTPEDDEAVKKILAAKPNLCPKYITQMIARNRLPNILPSIAQLIDLNNDKLSIATLKKIESAAKNARIYQERKQRE